MLLRYSCQMCQNTCQMSTICTIYTIINVKNNKVMETFIRHQYIPRVWSIWNVEAEAVLISVLQSTSRGSSRWIAIINAAFWSNLHVHKQSVVIAVHFMCRNSRFLFWTKWGIFFAGICTCCSLTMTSSHWRTGFLTLKPIRCPSFARAACRTKPHRKKLSQNDSEHPKKEQTR